jgi:hypothetical protein
MDKLNQAISTGTLWDFQIRDIIEALGLTSRFVGIYDHDQIPNVLATTGQFAIWNLAGANSPGTHWVTGILLRDRSLYFDPFGVPPDGRSEAFLSQGNRMIDFNNYDLQEFHSDECGWYCLAFIICVTRGLSLNQALSEFHQRKGWFNELKAVLIVLDSEDNSNKKIFLSSEKMPGTKSVKQGFNRKLTNMGHPELRVHEKKEPNAYARFVKQRMQGHHYGSKEATQMAMKQVAAEWRSRR